MSATMMLSKMTEMMAEATAIIAKMNEVMPALLAAANAEKTTLGSSKAKKPVSKGTMAWHAFVEHCKDTMPEMLSQITSHKELMQVIKIHKENDADGYHAFVSEWKATQISSSNETEPVNEEIVTIPVIKNKEKKKAAAGTMAWHAFVEHCKDTMPEMLSQTTSRKELMQVIKTHKESDVDGYDAFVSEWKAAHIVATE